MELLTPELRKAEHLIAATIMALGLTACQQTDQVEFSNLAKGACKFMGEGIVTEGYIEYVSSSEEATEHYRLYGAKSPASEARYIEVDYEETNQVFLPATSSEGIYHRPVVVRGEISANASSQSSQNCWISADSIRSAS